MRAHRIRKFGFNTLETCSRLEVVEEHIQKVARNSVWIFDCLFFCLLANL